MSSVRSGRLSSSEGAQTTANVILSLQNASKPTLRARSMPEDRYKGPASPPIKIPVAVNAHPKIDDFLLGSSPCSDKKMAALYLQEEPIENDCSVSRLSGLSDEDDESVWNEEIKSVKNLPEPESAKIEPQGNSNWDFWDMDLPESSEGEELDALPIESISLKT